MTTCHLGVEKMEAYPWYPLNWQRFEAWPEYRIEWEFQTKESRRRIQLQIFEKNYCALPQNVYLH